MRPTTSTPGMKGSSAEAGDALADVDVKVVERARGDVDRDLARPGLRVGELLQPKHVDAAELVEHDRLHTRPPVDPHDSSMACVYV
jgi:hypothetical protein